MSALIYVVGASGVGKDTVLALLRQRITAGDRIAVAHRYITRPAHAGGENHVALSEAEFALRLAAGCFALHWQSHGLHYGVGCEINAWRAAGLQVVVNGSRAHWPAVAAQEPAARLVEIVADEEHVRRRLLARGRDTAEAVDARLARNRRLAAEPLPAALRLPNEGAAEDTAHRLLAWLRAGAPVG